MIFARSFNTPLFISAFLLCFAVSYNTQHPYLRSQAATQQKKKPFCFQAQELDLSLSLSAKRLQSTNQMRISNNQLGMATELGDAV